MRRALTLLLAVLALGLLAPTRGAAAASTVREQGYLTMADGTKLAYTLVRPAGPGPFPTLFEYSGYDPGRTPDAAYVRRFVEEDGGYAYLGVNLRGTGCSEGTFDFFQPQEAVDGAAVIAWARTQPWSSGLVGMIGKSYPGITQLFVAEQRPPGLAAIAPGHFFADAYRDVARPGGITNHGFATLWSFVARPSYEVQSGPQYVLAGDLGCLNGVTGELRSLPTNPYVQLLQHPYDDALIRERSPITHVADLQVPMLASLAWQDEQLASRQTHLLSALDDLGSTSWWATLSNGDHSMSRTPDQLADLERFYDHFLKGEDNGWEDRPRVRVWWEAGRRGGARAPGWVTGLDHWSEAQRRADGELAPLALALRAGGRLTPEPADAAEAPSQYLYVPVAGSQGVGNARYGYPGLPDRYLWDVPPPSGTAAAFTSDPLASDLTLLGSASLDLWLAATAPDVDLQVTLTEVRPDGQEVFVQQGWLRASQRALTASGSTELLPRQSHQAADVQLLQPGQAVLARVEIFPFGQVLRAGSRLRVWVDAPTFLPQLWAFTPSPVPAAVTILHDAAHPSRLVLPEVPDDAERARDRPACGLVIRQPCRPDPLSASAAGPGAPGPVPGDPGGPGAGGGDPSGSPANGGPASPGAAGGRLPATGGSTAALGMAAALRAASLVVRRLLAAPRPLVASSRPDQPSEGWLTRARARAISRSRVSAMRASAAAWRRSRAR
jgi:putative CocE/NonD family hydrolase